MKKICHRTMGTPKHEQCIEMSCMAWGPIKEVDCSGPGVPFVTGNIVMGCRDFEFEQPTQG